MMSLNVRPILSALSRNRTGAILVALEIAIALAVMVNASWIVAQRIAQIEAPSGIDARDTFAIGVARLTSHSDLAAALRADLAYLRSLPGVVAVTATSSVPLSRYGQGTSVSRDPGDQAVMTNTRAMDVDAATLDTLGVRIVAGRNFGAADILPLATTFFQPYPQVLITQSLADELFPDGKALGKPIYAGDNTPMTVIGITSNFIPSVPTATSRGYDVLMFPQVPGNYGVYFCLVRTRPGRTEALLHTAQRYLVTSNPDRIFVLAQTLQFYRQRLDAANRSVVIFLTLVTALILCVTCLGIFGLTTFNVSTRTKQIGTMRAVGARKRDVVVHFLVENAIVLIAGAIVGCMLTLGVGHWLTDQYQLPRLDLHFLGVGIVTLAVIGLLAAWQPARRAASVPPSVATRTV
ncbi:MAG TPA: FtsX-like permease family protein [Steroidobacteraceae bacterium]|nr:FtsX-like permease family protein [Steroidobacteraceae bacterium]